MCGQDDQESYYDSYTDIWEETNMLFNCPWCKFPLFVCRVQEILKRPNSTTLFVTSQIDNNKLML